MPGKNVNGFYTSWIWIASNNVTDKHWQGKELNADKTPAEGITPISIHRYTELQQNAFHVLLQLAEGYISHWIGIW